MCGIVGYLGNREARQILVDCLSRLDSEPYDSAGIGMVAGGKLKPMRSIGSSAGLKAALKRTPLEAGRERVLARLPAAATLPVGVAADRVNLDDLFAELT